MEGISPPHEWLSGGGWEPLNIQNVLLAINLDTIPWATGHNLLQCKLLINDIGVSVHAHDEQASYI